MLSGKFEDFHVCNITCGQSCYANFLNIVQSSAENHSVTDCLSIFLDSIEIVNLDKVLRYDFTLAGTLRLELTGGIETWASRRCIPVIRKRLQGKEDVR